jgi:hypothetical protein
MFFKDKSWFYLFQNRRDSTLKYIDKIFASGKHVDEKLRVILLKMQSSLYLRENYAFNSYNYEKNNLADYSTVFYNYFELIQELKNLYDKNLKKYYHRNLPDKEHVLIPIGKDKYKLKTLYRK